MSGERGLHCDKFTKNYHKTPLSSMELLSLFQVVVFIILPIKSTFINLISNITVSD